MVGKDDKTRMQLFEVCKEFAKSESVEAQKIAVIIGASLVAQALGRLDQLYLLALSMEDDMEYSLEEEGK